MPIVDDLTSVRVGRSFTTNWAFAFGESACFTYEIYDRHRRLIYVGITGDFAARWSSHLRASWWARSVDIGHVLLRGYESRRDARKAEAVLIDAHHPPCNTKPELKYLDIARREGNPIDQLDVLVAELIPTRRF